MRRTVLTFGAMSGAILSGMLLLTLPFADAIGFDKGMLVGYATMVLAFMLVYFGVRSYRDHQLSGRISMGRAFAVGLLITLVASACYVATWQLIYFKLAPDFNEKYAAYAMEQARKSGATAAELAERAKEMAEFGKMYSNPLVNAAITFLEPLPVGLLFTLVTAIVLSRRPRDEKQ